MLSDAQVDLNPHQIEAALFAFRNPLSRGAILADEVGLGKTIEAGLLIAQKWAEQKCRILVIAPANLRKQWAQELGDKFFLPSAILETRTFNEAVRAGNLNPFQQNAIIICSYQFAKKMEPYIRQTSWELVVIDEAHRLRDVYKPTNKIANAIKQAVALFRKVLLTATPLQNSLLELYGLVSTIDDFAFGDLKTYRSRFTRLGNDTDFNDLKERLRPICKRTLRKQVLEFVPTQEEQRLYDLVSEYLQQPTLYALPASQRSLMTLILRKLLASSTYAIYDTLSGLALKLETAAKQAEAVDAPPEDLADNLEEFDELADEWEPGDSEDDAKEKPHFTPEQITQMRAEMAKLREFHALAQSIARNSKGEVLLTALRRGFAASVEAQKEKKVPAIQQKALIFTDARRTPEYRFRILEKTEFAGKVMVFNGTNSDANSKDIYRRWLETNQGTDRVSGFPGADMRAALVEHFRNEASIMIATEAAAEGINLQFFDEPINKLFVMANESYEDFARALQTEYEEDCGVTFGKVPITAIAKLARVVDGEPQPIGRKDAEAIQKVLVEQKMLDTEGRLLPGFDPKKPDFKIELPQPLQELAPAVVDLLASYQIERHIRQDKDEGVNRLKKEVLITPEFQALWEQIKPKTQYRVEFETDELVRRAVAAIKKMQKIEAAKIRVTAGQVGVVRGGVTATAISAAEEQITYRDRPVPDVLAYLQNETELTRSTLVRILKELGRLPEFFVDPQRFMDAVAGILKHELHRLLVDGIKYERIDGSGTEAEWEMLLFKNEELVNYLTALQVNHSVYDHVVYYSEVEKEFAKRLDERQDIRLFVKLPNWFEIDTPVGKYNPDWAIVKYDDETLYLVRETKSTKDFLKLRPSEADKVHCGQKHFETLGVSFSVVVSPDEV